MKIKTTQKAIKSNYSYIICVPYCTVQWLVSNINPIAYWTRAEGWGCDVYELAPNVALTTGYAPFGNIKPSYDTYHKYEQLAKSVIFDKDDRYRGNPNYAAELASLRAKFVQEVLQDEYQA